MKLLCNYPGCSEQPSLDPAKVSKWRRNTWDTVEYGDKGTCPIHGQWAACLTHRRLQEWDEIRGDSREYSCPLCAGEAAAWEQQEIHASSAEADRRNAEEARRNPPLTIEAAIAQFRAEGYGVQAAEALARKQVGETTSQRGLPWYGRSSGDHSVFDERWRARRQRRLETGEAAVCPACKRDAPASEGVILAHMTPRTPRDSDDWGGWERCYGEGSVVTQPS
jgi:hypothetical protein